MAVDRWVVTDSVHDRGHGVDEDRIGAVQRLAWVLDGASPLGDERVTGERSDAAWIADTVDGALRSAAQGPPASLVDVTERAIAAVVERSAEWSHVPRVPPSAAFGIVALRDSGGLEYLVLGDVSVVIETADREVIALTDPSVARTSRPAMERFEGSLRRTRSHAVARREIDAALIEHRVSSMNRDGGYWIVANDAGAARHAMTGAIDGPARARPALQRRLLAGGRHVRHRLELGGVLRELRPRAAAGELRRTDPRLRARRPRDPASSALVGLRRRGRFDGGARRVASGAWPPTSNCP